MIHTIDPQFLLAGNVEYDEKLVDLSSERCRELFVQHAADMADKFWQQMLDGRLKQKSRTQEITK